MEPDGEATFAAHAAPTPEKILGWIAASGTVPWFPSRHADKTGIPRDALDEPLNELRTAELVRIVDWVRGVGQGYALTPNGETALNGTMPVPETAPPSDDSPAESPKSDLLDLRPPVVTPALLLANLLWYLIGLIIAIKLGDSLKDYLLRGDSAVFVRLGAVGAVDLLHGEWWRLATCCFVHGTIWHLCINLFNLGMVGALAELIWDRWRVFLIYMISGFAGSCLAMGLAPVDPVGGVSTMLVGASGAICGLASSVAAWLWLYSHRLRQDVRRELTWKLGLGFTLTVVVGFLPGVSWQAHLGGAIAGFIAALVLNAVRHTRGYRRGLAIVVAALLPALCAGGLLLTIKHSDRWATSRQHPVILRPTRIFNPYLPVEGISPALVNPVLSEAGQLLLLTPTKQTPDRIVAARVKVQTLLLRARVISNRSTPAEDGNRIRAYAEAVARPLELMLKMLDAKTLPTAAQWKTWGASRREAIRLWNEIGNP